MGKFANYVLVSDMDGTLLNTKERVSEENKEAIQRFIEGGGHFCVATGRTPVDAKPHIEDLPINTPCIFFNGAILYDYHTQDILKEFELEGEVWHDFAHMLITKYPQLTVHIFSTHRWYAIGENHENSPHWERLKKQLQCVELDDILDQKWIKLMVIAEPEEIQKMLPEIEKLGIDKQANSFFAARDCYEFVSKNASKGHMLEFLRELPENKGRKIVAQGDYGNDVYMLQMADVGIAAGNAHEDTKKAADIIGVTNDENLAAYTIGLIEEGKI